MMSIANWRRQSLGGLGAADARPASPSGESGLGPPSPPTIVQRRRFRLTGVDPLAFARRSTWSRSLAASFWQIFAFALVGGVALPAAAQSDWNWRTCGEVQVIRKAAGRTIVELPSARLVFTPEASDHSVPLEADDLDREMKLTRKVMVSVLRPNDGTWRYEKGILELRDNGARFLVDVGRSNLEVQFNKKLVPELELDEGTTLEGSKESPVLKKGETYKTKTPIIGGVGKPVYSVETKSEVYGWPSYAQGNGALDTRFLPSGAPGSDAQIGLRKTGVDFTKLELRACLLDAKGKLFEAVVVGIEQIAGQTGFATLTVRIPEALPVGKSPIVPWRSVGVVVVAENGTFGAKDNMRVSGTIASAVWAIFIVVGVFLLCSAGVQFRAQDKTNKGRRHNNYGYSMWMAGGGVKGGITHGATDEIGERAVDNTVHTHDLHATILHLLGLNHEKLTYRYAGRDFRLTDVYGDVVADILR